MDISTEFRRFEKDEKVGRCRKIRKPDGALCWLPIDG